MEYLLASAVRHQLRHAGVLDAVWTPGPTVWQEAPYRQPAFLLAPSTSGECEIQAASAILQHLPFRLAALLDRAGSPQPQGALSRWRLVHAAGELPSEGGR